MSNKEVVSLSEDPWRKGVDQDNSKNFRVVKEEVGVSKVSSYQKSVEKRRKGVDPDSSKNFRVVK